MFSKKRRLTKRVLAALIGASAVFSAVSCSFGEKAHVAAQLVLNGNTGCMNGASQTLNDYLQGKLASDQPITDLAKCADDSLQLFTQDVRGANPGYFTSDEVRIFLQRFFIKNMTITDPLLADAMQLKQVIVGGSASTFTQAEIARSRTFIQIAAKHAIALRPYLPMLPSSIGGQKMSAITLATIQSLATELDAAATEVGGYFQADAASYSFDQIDRLLGAIETAPQTAPMTQAQQAKSDSNFDNLRSYVTLAKAMKSNLIGPDGGAIATASDWTSTLQDAAHWYDLALKLSWFFASPNTSLLSGDGLEQVHTLMTSAISMLQSSLDRHPGKMIAFAELDTLVDALPDSALPVPVYNPQKGQVVTRDTLKGLLVPLVQRYLGGRNTGADGRAAQGLTLPALQNLQADIDVWYQGQKVLQSIFLDLGQSAGVSSTPLILQAYDGESIRASGVWSTVAASSDPTQVLAGKLLRAMVTPPSWLLFPQDEPTRPLFDRDETEISFREGLEYSFYDLSSLAWMRELVYLMIQGYAQDPARSDGSSPGAQVTFAEFQQAFNDVHDLGTQMRIFDPQSTTTAASRFREANLFTFAGNGDTYMNTQEGAQMLGLLLSAMRLSHRMYAAVSGACPVGALDKYNYPQIPDDCYRTQMMTNYPRFFIHMPELVRYLQGLSADNRKIFFADLEAAARNYSDEGWVDSDVFDHTAAISQYLETIFLRFDVNGDGTLTGDEAKNAFPIFKHTLSQMAACQGKSLSDWQLYAVFAYMLTNGESPSDIWDFLEGLGQAIFDNYQADRSRVVKIFAQLNAGLGATATGATQNPACSEP